MLPSILLAYRKYRMAILITRASPLWRLRRCAWLARRRAYESRRYEKNCRDRYDASVKAPRLRDRATSMGATLA